MKFPPGLYISLPENIATNQLLESIRKCGAEPLVDFHAPSPGTVFRFLRTLENQPLIRIFRGTSEVLQEVQGLAGRVKGVFLEARNYLTPEFRALESLGIPLGLNVESRGDVETASDFDKMAVIGRGNEVGGFSGPVGALVMFQLMKRFLRVPFLLEGGLSMETALASLAAGASGVVLGSALYGFPEFGPSISEETIKLRGSDTIRLADSTGNGFRIHCPTPADLSKLKAAVAGKPAEAWPAQLPPGTTPLGMDVEFAGENRRKHGTLAGWTAEFFRRASSLPVVPKVRHSTSRFCRKFGSAFPFIQGPMARISDKPRFLKAIADAGGIPTMAFASSDPEKCRQMLTEASMSKIPTGVGIIGLDLQSELVSRQIEVLREIPPRFVLVAAPKPGLVQKLLEYKLEVIAHAQGSKILEALEETGCRTFVAEGSESGGHIGRFTSMVLWQDILAAVSEGDPEAFNLVFAGGIAGKEGTHFLSALVEIFGLTGRLTWGVQLGTPYLATREIVETGAVGRNYRNWVMNGEVTLVTGETVNLRVRQVASPFISEILTMEEEMVLSGIPLPERKQAFEADNIGNLGRAVSSIEGEDGCFMAGESIALLDQIKPIRSLHRELFEEVEQIDSSSTHGAASITVPRPIEALEPAPKARAAHDVAIIGIGCVFPGSPDPASFFRNVLERRCFIKALPESMLDPAIFFSEDRLKPYSTYSRIGAVIEEVPFDPVMFRIPPRVAAHLDTGQKLALICARQALLDAGYLEKPFDRENCGVIIGNSMGGNASVENLRAIHFHEFLEKLLRLEAGVPEKTRSDLVKAFRNLNPTRPITEDSLPGELSTIIAGRVCSTFDLHGPNFTIDAACGSGLAAVAVAVQALRLGSISVALAGGIDVQMDPGSFVKFAKVTALSAEGSFPFDSRASGFVMGEGGGLVMLKRLEDALSDGDQIYAVIRGIGASSDGRGKGITAPNPEGQKRALERAWRDAGLSPAQAAYFEAHGTGTRVGDEIELSSLSGVIGARKGGQPRIPVGSVKAMIGHAKAAAGIAGMLKAVLAVHQRIIPPQVNFEGFPPTVDADKIPLFIPRAPAGFEGESFLAGVSSFGFGGTNHHVVLSEAPKNKARLEIRFSEIPDGPDIKETRPTVSAGHSSIRPLVAGVFPGQGSQYVNMISAFRGEPSVSRILGEAERVFRKVNGDSLLEAIFQETRSLPPERLEQAEATLQTTLFAQPAIFATSAALLELLREKGLQFDMYFGHSLGEYSALYAAGAFSLEDALEAVCIRGKYMNALGGTDLGAMAVIGLGASEVGKVLDDFPGYLICSNLNSPSQTVISGDTPTVEAAIKHFTALGILAKRLRVSAGFHSKLVEKAIPPFEQMIRGLAIKPPSSRVPGNVHGAWYPEAESGKPSGESKREETIRLLMRQAVSPVDFIDQVERAYQAGVRVFVEVGPKNVLSRLIESILAPRPHECFHIDNPRQQPGKLMEKLLQRLLQPSGIPTPAQASGQPPAPAQPAAPPRPPSDLEGAVMALIEEVSGYPSDMIQPDTDLEGDLGIDTLKIFEIANRLRENFGLARNLKLDLSRLRTFRSLTGLFRDALEAGGAGSIAPSSLESPVPHPTLGIHRHVLRIEDSSVPLLEEFPSPAGIGLVRMKSTGNPDFDSRMVELLAPHGIACSIWSPTDHDQELLESGDFPESLRDTGTYIHTLPSESFSRKTRKRFYRHHVLSMFLAARLLGRGIRRFIVLADAGGVLGEPADSVGKPGFLAGVIPAFCQTLEKDFPNLVSMGFDLPDFSPETAEQVAPLLFAPRLEPIIGLPPSGSPKAFRVVPDPEATPIREVLEGLRKVIGQKTVILATGGAKGITARIVTRLAREFQPVILILGRSSEQNEVLQALRSQGATAVYYPCDLSDGPAVDRTAETIARRFPRIDILIHGAGIEISRNLANKTPEEIDRVYRVKVAGLVNLLDALGEDRIGSVVSFSSVASLFGNHGQADYAAANGFLNRFSGSGQARFLTISWTAWAGIGLAARPSVEHLLKAQGVEFIDPAAGEELFLGELHRSLVTDQARFRTVSYHGFLGEAMTRSRRYEEASPQEKGIGDPGQPQTRSEAEDAQVDKEVESLSVIRLAPSDYRFLGDHAIDGKCIFPAVMYIHRMLDQAGVLSRFSGIATVRDLSFHAPFRFSSFQRLTLQTEREGDLFRMTGNPKTGSQGRKTPHFTGRFDPTGAGPSDRVRMTDQVRKVGLLLADETSGFCPTRNPPARDELYRILFHGRTFQVIDRVEEFNRRALRATVSRSPAILENNPLADHSALLFAIEAGLHGAGILCLLRVFSRRFFLPSAIGEMLVDLDALRANPPATVSVELLGVERDSAPGLPMLRVGFNVTVSDDRKNPLVHIRNLVMVTGKEEPGLKNTFVSVGVPFQVGDYPFMGVSLGDADRLLASPSLVSSLLSATEQEVLAALRTPKRSREWVSGRIALKILAREILRDRTGIEISFPHFSVLSGSQPPHFVPGAEVPPGASEVLKSLHPTISHSGEIGVATCSTVPIGIDIEPFRPLSGVPSQSFLNERESALLPKDELVTLWTAKEAVSKTLRTGFGVKDFTRIRILSFGYNEPYEAMLEGVPGGFRVLSFKDADFVVSIAVAVPGRI